MEKYLKEKKKNEDVVKKTNDDHEIPVLGDFNTIVEGFASGVTIRLTKKRCVMNVMYVQKVD